MTEVPGFVILSPPRTKKNSGNIVHLPKKDSFRCTSCGQRRVKEHGKSGMFPKILPSEAYDEWEKCALEQSFGIKHQLAAAGVVLPLVGSLSVEAHIYRQQASGDVAGFIQAIGDMLQKAGIIKNDVQIEDWDGTRRLKDAANPRVEVFITVLDEPAVQEDLPL